MRYWDSSAIVPLLVREPATERVTAAWLGDPEMAVWWATTIECVSALSRLEREGAMRPVDVTTSLNRLDALSLAWIEVEPGSRVRELAIRLLRTHPLRGADALQLAAAIVAAEERPSTLHLVTLDARLAEAAAREGFTIEAPAG